MSQDNVETIRFGYEAFERGDLPVVFDLLDPEAEFYQSEELLWGGLYKGQEQIQLFFTRLAQAIDSKVESERFIDAGDRVVQVGYTQGTVRATGKAFKVPEVHVWTLQNGKIVRYEGYIDNPTMLAALEP